MINEALRFRPRLLAAATRLTGGDRAEAEDLVQDTLVRALRAGERRPETTLACWLLTIQRRLFIDRVRARRARAEVSIALDGDGVEVAPPDDGPLAAIEEGHVWSAVARLDERSRRVFSLHARDRLSYGEIAARLRIPRRTVGTRLLRARRTLRQLLLEA